MTQRLGRTGPVLSGFGLGLAALGRPAYITVGHARDLPQGRSVEAMEAHAHRVLDHAFALGVRYFDAARSYGRAEAFLRSWVDSRGIRPGEVAIGSKWGYRYTGDWQVDGRVQEVKDHGVEMLRAQAAESTSILGPYLGLYQIHSATPETGVLEDAQVIGELRRLREGGLFLGVTVTGLSQLETLRRAVDLRFDGEQLFSAVQATWNVLERKAGPGLREAHDAGLAVLVKEPLANGRLTPRGDAGRDGPLRAVAERLGSPADAVALAFVAKERWADLVLLGAATEEQVASNLQAQRVNLAEEDLRALEEMRLPAEEYWSQRARLAWD
ncbi:MAG TPA: aldo/keto reductase [Myxococcales bacterium]|nr:aldo/keto reductase [Myxococcales bacterium]